MANPNNFKILKEQSVPHVVFRLVPAATPGRVFYGCSDFKVYDATLGDAKFEPKELYAHESYVTGLCRVGSLLVSGGYDGRMIWWDLEARKQVRAVEAHAKWIRNVISSPDGKRLASVGDDMVCRVWDSQTGQRVHELRGHAERTPQHFPSMLYAVAFSRDGKLLATGDKVGKVFVWDLATGQSVAALEAPVMYTWDQVQRLHSIGGIRSLAFSPDGKQLAVGGMGKVGNIDHLEGKSRVEVFDWKKGERLVEFPGDKFNGLVNALAYGPDAAWLIGAGGANEGFVQFYDVAQKKVLRQDKVGSHLHDLILEASGDAGIAVGHNRIIRFEIR